MSIMNKIQTSKDIKLENQKLAFWTLFNVWTYYWGKKIRQNKNKAITVTELHLRYTHPSVPHFTSARGLLASDIRNWIGRV